MIQRSVRNSVTSVVLSETALSRWPREKRVVRSTAFGGFGLMDVGGAVTSSIGSLAKPTGMAVIGLLVPTEWSRAKLVFRDAVTLLSSSFFYIKRYVAYILRMQLTADR